MNILKINSSGNKAASVSRQYVDKLVAQLEAKNSGATVVDHDLPYENLPYVTETMIGGFYNPEPTPEQQEVLALSDKLVEELLAADTVVIGAPIYNFGIPAALKAYIDLVSRAGKTFKFTEQGPVGLVPNKKVYVVVASGGTPVGSPYDFVSSYLKTVLGFLGMTDVEVVSLDQMQMVAEEKKAAADAFVAAV